MPRTMSPTNHRQVEKFKEAARELGAEDDSERFAETVRKIAKSPPSPQSRPPKKPDRGK